MYLIVLVEELFKIIVYDIWESDYPNKNPQDVCKQAGITRSESELFFTISLSNLPVLMINVISGIAQSHLRACLGIKFGNWG
jgi:hypothetical protein